MAMESSGTCIAEPPAPAAMLEQDSELPTRLRQSNGALLEQQKMIFSASSNNSRRRDHLLESQDGEDYNRSILETAPLEFVRAHMLLEETSSFGENKQQFKAPGSVPFKWEDEPGKPKSPSPNNNVSTHLQPPPSCLSRESSRRDYIQKHVSSPTLSDKLRSLLQLKLSSPVRSPTVSSLSKNSAEPRSSPVSILDARKVFGASSDSCSSSPTRLSSSSRNTEHQVESPLSSARFKKQLSLEIWERSLRESSSSSTTGCGFLKHMLVGCWHKPSSSKYGSSSFENSYELPRVSIYAPGTLGGELESFKERLEEDDCEQDGFFCEDQELEEALEQQQAADEVHAVDEGELVAFPVSAAFVFSKPALKKKKSGGIPHATCTSNKRVRFLIEDYSSDEDSGSNDEGKRRKEDLFEDAISTEDEGFQRPARSVIRRRRKKKDTSNNTNNRCGVPISKPSPVGESSFHANYDSDGEPSPDLQPMQDLVESIS